MELLDNLLLGMSTAAQPVNLLYCFIGTLLGTLIGVLPGLGPTATIAMLLPITYSLQPVSSLIMLAGIYYGAQYGGSTTAILVNLPGESSSAVTTLDGYQMARQGRAGPALAIAALGSFFAGTVATFIIAAAAPPLTAIALKFGAAEYFSLMLARPDHLDGPCPWLDRQGARHDRARPAARPGRHRRQHRHAALHARLPGAGRRHQLRCRRGGRVRHRRDPAQSGERARPRGRHQPGHRPLAGTRGSEGDGGADGARHAARLGARHSARRRRGARLVRRLYRGEEDLHHSRALRAAAPSRAWRARRAPTTRPRRPPSSRC